MINDTVISIRELVTVVLSEPVSMTRPTIVLHPPIYTVYLWISQRKTFIKRF